MRIRSVVTCLVGICLSALCSVEAQSQDRQRNERLSATLKVDMDYLLYLPKDHDNGQQWPLLLFLHGAGERGSDLELVKKHGPPKQIEAGKDFPCVVVSPQCAPDGRWNPLTLSVLIDEVVREQRIDEDRIYVTGLSMGGFGTWSLACHMPERLAAIVPICGGGERFMARRIKNLPAWVFHGARDTVVPLERSESMVNELKQRGNDVKFTVYPEAGHDSWTESYDNPELYEWLLQQRRSSPN